MSVGVLGWSECVRVTLSHAVNRTTLTLCHSHSRTNVIIRRKI